MLCLENAGDEGLEWDEGCARRSALCEGPAGLQIDASPRLQSASPNPPW